MLNFFRHTSINARLWFMLGLILITLLSASVYLAYDFKKLQLMDKQLQLVEFISSGESVVKYFDGLVEKGQLNENEAEAKMLEVLASIRGDKGGYLTVLTTDGTVLMHPHLTKLVGQKLTGMKDVNGKLFVAEMLEKMNKNGEGVVNYYWPKPGEAKENAKEKVTHITKIAHKNWSIMSGIWVDELNAQLKQNLIKLFSGTLLLCLGIACIILFLSRSIINSIKKITTAMDRIADDSDGDLTQRLPIQGNDELTALATSFNRLFNKLHGAIKYVGDASTTIKATSDNLSGITEKSSAGFHQQNSSLNHVAEIIKGISERSSSVSDNAKQAANMAAEASAETAVNQTSVSNTISAIGAMAKNVNTASEVVSRLQDESDRIGSVIDVIGSIAEQTNLLALNAAIEAARAGEQGRGFAVVADEVRTLASRTQESTQEINQMIERLQSGVKEASSVMESSRSDTENTLEQAGKTGESLQNIATAVSGITSMTNQISDLVGNQFSAVQEANESINDVMTMTGEYSASVENIINEVGTLSVQGDSLKQQMSGFKL